MDRDTGMQEQSVFREQRAIRCGCVVRLICREEWVMGSHCVCTTSRKALNTVLRNFGVWSCGQLKSSFIYKQRSVTFRLRV